MWPRPSTATVVLQDQTEGSLWWHFSKGNLASQDFKNRQYGAWDGSAEKGLRSQLSSISGRTHMADTERADPSLTFMHMLGFSNAHKEIFLKSDLKQISENPFGVINSLLLKQKVTGTRSPSAGSNWAWQFVKLFTCHRQEVPDGSTIVIQT